jgi:WD40 repeat protein
MVCRRHRFFRSAIGLLFGLLLFSHWRPSSWAEATGMLQFERTLQWDQKVCGRFVFARDGKTVAGCSLDWFGRSPRSSKLRAWAVDSGTKVADFDVPGDNIISIAFSQDGQMLFSCAWGGTVRVHDLRTLKTEIIPDLVGHGLAISPDGRQLACVVSRSVWIVDVASRKIAATKTLEKSSSGDAFLPVFSPNGKVLAIAREGGPRVRLYEVELCDASTLRSIAIIRDEAPPVRSMSYSPDGSLLAIGDDGGGVALWDANAAKRERKVSFVTGADFDAIVDVAFSPDGKLLGIGGSRTALLLKADTLDVVDRVKGQGVFTLAFSPNGTFLLTGNGPYVEDHQSDKSHDIRLWRVGRH